MMYLTLIGLTMLGACVYLYMNVSDEIPHILVLLFVLNCAFWGLVLTPWEFQLGLLLLILFSTRHLFDPSSRRLG